MNDHHEVFNDEMLSKIKDDFLGYRYCPRCGQEMDRKRLDGRDRLVCPSPSCMFIFYHNPIPAAGVMVVKDDKILLVKRAHPPRIGWWCIPAGFMEWNENPAQTAVRELAEETGLEIRLSGIFEAYAGLDDPRANAVLILYLGDIIGGEMVAADDALDVGFFPLDNLPAKIAFEAHEQALRDYCRRFDKPCSLL